MKTVFYKIKKEKSEYTVTFWLQEREKDKKEEKFVIVEPDRLKFRFKNVFKFQGPFEIEEVV